MPEIGDPQSRAVPRVPVSVGALVFDRRRRLLLLKPTYKSGWTLPGGEMEADGESPWDACRREVLEECGLRIMTGRLVGVDFRRPRSGRPGGVRFLFDCGTLDDDTLSRVALPPWEISEHRLVELPEALALLRKALRRRVAAAVAADGFVYLEQGRPVSGVG
jgi:ADP-ribose pyrophosphatase YjhB (NUDIX family)